MSKLLGKRVVITRPKAQSQNFISAFIAYGAIPISFPVLEIGPIMDTSELDAALENLENYSWLILTSVNGVEAVWERFEVLKIAALPSSLKIACVGPKTARALGSKGYTADYIPAKFIGVEILPGLGDLSGLRVLLTRADLARPDLPRAIRAGGGIADDICAYRTIPADVDQNGFAEIAAGTDLITFTSPSTVDNFYNVISAAGLDPRNLPGSPQVACIGPITAKAASKKGYSVDIMPYVYTIEGLLVSINNHFENGRLA